MQGRVLEDLTAIKAKLDEMKDEDSLVEQIAKLKAENQRLREQNTRKATVRLSEKGTISVYGVGRFPASFYKSQWMTILAAKDQIEALYAMAPDKE